MSEATERPLVSPRSFVVLAIAIAVLFGVAHAVGLREHTSILSGTSLAVESAAAGVIYTLLYFAFVLGAPILILAAAIFWGLSRRARR
jgi:hypothetical protein